MTQAVVKGPIGEETAVLGAAGHDVCRGLWRQRGGAWGLDQSLVACVGHRVPMENSGVMARHLFPIPRRHSPA